MGRWSWIKRRPAVYGRYQEMYPMRDMHNAGDMRDLLLDAAIRATGTWKISTSAPSLQTRRRWRGLTS